MRARLLLGAVGLLLPLLLGGCPIQVRPAECIVSSDCPGGTYCSGGRCVSDCAPGGYCPSGQCDSRGQCIVSPPPQCRSTADCGSGTYCSAAGQCVSDCAAGGYCPSGQCDLHGQCMVNPSQGRVSLTWEVQDAKSKSPLTCSQAGGAVVRVTTASVLAGGKTYIDDFRCDALRGTTDPVDAGSYQVTVALLDASDRSLAATSPIPLTVGSDIDLGHVVFQVNTSPTQARLLASWEVRDAKNKMRLSCAEAGAARVHLLAKGTSHNAESYFNCGDGQGATTVDVDRYDVTVTLLSTQAEVLSTITLRATVSGPGDVDLGMIEFNVNREQEGFSLSWEIAEAATGIPQSCAQAGASVVRLISENLDQPGSERFVDDFACTAYAGVTGPVSVGNFRVDVQLLDPRGTALSTIALGTQNVTAPGVVDLGHVVFNVGG